MRIVIFVELSRTGMRYEAKLLTLSPQIVSKKSSLSILVNDEFQYCIMTDAVEFFIHFIFYRTFFNVITFNFISFYLLRRLV